MHYGLKNFGYWSHSHCLIFITNLCNNKKNVQTHITYEWVDNFSKRNESIGQLKRLKNKGKLFTLFFTNQSRTFHPGGSWHANGTLSPQWLTRNWNFVYRFDSKSNNRTVFERDELRACDRSEMRIDEVFQFLDWPQKIIFKVKRIPKIVNAGTELPFIFEYQLPSNYFIGKSGEVVEVTKLRLILTWQSNVTYFTVEGNLFWNCNWQD